MGKAEYHRSEPLLEQDYVANGAAVLNARAIQYAISNCKPLLFRLPRKWWDL